jgi:hypothetical protein
MSCHFFMLRRLCAGADSHQQQRHFGKGKVEARAEPSATTRPWNDFSVLISPVQRGIRLHIPATSKTVTPVRYPAAPLLALGILVAPVTASADQLCGRQFDSLSQLYAELRREADHGWRVIERSTHVILAGNQMIWAFARDSQPAFPAAACLQIVQVDDSMGAIVQTRCEGAKDACDAVAAKANTKDWSNLFGN